MNLLGLFLLVTFKANVAGVDRKFADGSVFECRSVLAYHTYFAQCWDIEHVPAKK